MSADIIFVIDKTANFAASDWSNIKAFLNHTIQYGSPKGVTRYGIITYNTSSTTVLSLNSNIYGDNAITYVNSMRLTGGTTANLGGAINTAITQFSTYGSSTKKKVLIVIAGGEASGSPCQYNPRDYDIFTYVIALGSTWVRKDLKCLVMSDNSYSGYTASITSSSSLSTIYSTFELITCPHQPDIRITEVQPLSTSNARYVEFYNFGHALAGMSLNFTGLFKGYVAGLSVSQGSYFVIYDSDDSSYPDCSSCTCSKLGSNSLTYWCSTATYVGCGTASGQGFESIKSTCAVQSSYSTSTGWLVTVSYSGTKLDNATYNSDTYWPTITTNYAYEKRKRLYNSNFGSSWGQTCKSGGTAGQDKLSSCTFTCSTTMCNLSGGGSCSGSYCACNNGYYSNNFTCNKFPPPSNCTGTLLTSSLNEYEFNYPRWDGLHYYTTTYCTGGTSSCTTNSTITSYGSPVSTTNEKYAFASANVKTRFDGSSSTSYSASTTCSLSTLSPTSVPTMSPTHSVPVINNCNITLNAAKTQYTVRWVIPTYGSGAPNTSSLTGYAIYEDGNRVASTTTPAVFEYTGAWQQSVSFNLVSDYVSVSGIWSNTDITDSREKSAAKQCTTYTQSPTNVPTKIPTTNPTRVPSGSPTKFPTPGPIISNVSISKCSVTYESSNVITVNWTLPTFTSTSINSSQAYYYLQWTSGAVTANTFWKANPTQTYVFSSNYPDNTTGKMYMYVGWIISGGGQGPKTRCSVSTSAPTGVPTTIPTTVPTKHPSGGPSPIPTAVPTNSPTPCPTPQYETLSFCVATISQRDTRANISFPLVNVTVNTPSASEIQFQFSGDSFTTVYVTQSSVSKTTNGLRGYQLIQLKNYDINNSSSYFKMFLKYTNLSCGLTYQYGPVTCSVNTASPSKSPTPAPTNVPTPSPTYGAIGVSFAKNDLTYCSYLMCNETSQVPIQLVNEGIEYNFYVQRTYNDYTYNISLVYNFSFVTEAIAAQYNFTEELQPYLLTYNDTTTNTSKIVVTRIPNDTYWNNDLTLENTWEGPTYGDLGTWSGVYNLESDHKVGYIPIEIIKESGTNPVRDYDGEVFMLTLTSCSINYAGPSYGDSSTCYITYPSQLFVIIKDLNVYQTTVTKTNKNNSYKSWFWYVIVAILLLLAVIGYFVYKWWVNKKMAEAQVTDVQGDIDAVITEQEKGFGNDLGKDNVTFNPLAQPLSHLQKPANNDWTTNTKPNNGELQEKAEVRVEKFNVKQEFGPQTVARRGDRM